MIELNLYNGKHALQFNESNHRYKVNGAYVPGVTSILGILDKGESLMQWAVNMAIEAIKAGQSYDEAKYAYRTKRDTAADVGKRVHEWIEAYTAGEELPIKEDMQQAVDAYLKWEKQNDIKHIHSERVLYSEKYNYCGTVDDVHMQGDLRVVNDYKTGNPDFEYDSRTRRYTGLCRPRIVHLMQDALYDQAMHEEDGLYADKYAVTYITKEGKLYYFETDQTELIRNLAIMVAQTSKLLKDATFNNKFRKVET